MTPFLCLLRYCVVYPTSFDRDGCRLRFGFGVVVVVHNVLYSTLVTDDVAVKTPLTPEYVTEEFLVGARRDPINTRNVINKCLHRCVIHKMIGRWGIDIFVVQISDLT